MAYSDTRQYCYNGPNGEWTVFNGKDRNISSERLKFNKDEKIISIPTYINKYVRIGNTPSGHLGIVNSNGQTRYIPLFDSNKGTSGSKGNSSSFATYKGHLCNLCYSNCNNNFSNYSACVSNCNTGCNATCNGCHSGCNSCNATCNSCHASCNSSHCGGCQSCQRGNNNSNGCTGNCNAGEDKVNLCTTCYTNSQCTSCYSSTETQSGSDCSCPSNNGTSCGSGEATVLACGLTGCCDTSSRNVGVGCGHCYNCVCCDGGTYNTTKPATFGKSPANYCCFSTCNGCQGCYQKCETCVSSCNGDCNSCNGCNSCYSGCNTCIACNNCHSSCNTCQACHSCEACVSCQSCDTSCYEKAY